MAAISPPQYKFKRLPFVIADCRKLKGAIFAWNPVAQPFYHISS
jgi:hypothetical protein